MLSDIGELGWNLKKMSFVFGKKRKEFIIKK
jgi:hypothetical protein